MDEERWMMDGGRRTDVGTRRHCFEVEKEGIKYFKVIKVKLRAWIEIRMGEGRRQRLIYSISMVFSNLSKTSLTLL